MVALLRIAVLGNQLIATFSNKKQVVCLPTPTEVWVAVENTIGADLPTDPGGGTGGPIDISKIPADATVGAYNREQLVNAALIANAGAAKGLALNGQTLGVQCAIGESSLINIAYGDGATNPDGSIADSIGLFQQQSSWGTVEERMDPTTSAGFFFDRLIALDGWEDMEPSLAIHRVQINADPDHYTKYRADAEAIMAYLSTLTVQPGNGDLYNPWADIAPSGSWFDHASYSAGGIDYPLRLDPLPAVGSGRLETSGGSGEFLAGNVGSAGIRSVLYLDVPATRKLPGEGEPPEGDGPMVAVVYQHQSEQSAPGHYDKGEIIGVSGNTGNNVWHLHIHGLTASGDRVDFLKYV